MLLKTTFYLARECTEKLGLSELAVQEKHEAFCGQFPDGTNCTYCLYHGITLLYMFTVLRRCQDLFRPSVEYFQTVEFV